MKISTRGTLGVVMVVISLLAVLLLYLTGTPLASLTSSQTDSSSEGSLRAAQFQVHWPLLAACAVALLGLVILAWPQRRPPVLPSPQS